MATIDAQSLLAASNCYACYAANPFMLSLIELGLLRQTLLAANPNATVDPQGLLEIAKCYECYGSNDYTLGLMKLALLKQIADNTA